MFSSVPDWRLGQDVEQSILAAFKNLGLLPCDPSEIKEPIEVILSGEMHGTKRSGDVVSMYLSEVDGNKTTMALEKNLEQKLPFPANSCDLVLKADGELAHSFCVLRSLLEEADSSNMIPTEKIEEYFLASKGLQETLATIAPPTNHPVRDLMEKIEQTVKWNDSQKKDGPPRPNHPGNVGATVLKNLIETIANGHFSRLSNKETAFQEVPPTIPDEISARVLRSKSFDKEMVVGYRDRNLGFSGLKMICRAAEKHLKKVVIHMGAGHMSGVFKFLVDSLERSKAASKVSVKADTSVLDDPGILTSEISSSEKFKKTYDEVLKGIAQIPGSNLISVPLPPKAGTPVRRISLPEFEFKETRGPNLSEARASEIKGDVYELLRTLSPEDYWSVDAREKIRQALNLAKEYAGIDPKSAKSLQLTARHDNKNFFPNPAVADHPWYLEICVIQPDDCIPVGQIGLLADPDNRESRTESKVWIQFHPSFVSN